VENGGKLVYVGIVQADIPLPDPEFHRRELTLFASRNATSEDFAHVIGALAAGQIHLDPWITHRATAETLVEDFANWLAPDYGVVKAMLEF
jgi:threonine dehydrogenase-like Zn-dependent dehydrogenase